MAKTRGDRSIPEKAAGGMQAHGLSLEFAEQVFHQIRGFGEYGFPESHAASFALLVYASAWLETSLSGRLYRRFDQ
jgi:DNA polymerase III alpha subunit